MSLDVITLDRFAYTMYGVFGTLKYGDSKLYTVERPWSDNRSNVSCIPTGVYLLDLSHYIQGDYPAYEVCGVPGRSAIKIHIGNTMDDVRGCIAPGLMLGWLGHKWAVIQSREAFDRFMEYMDGAPGAILHVRDYVSGA